MLAEELASPVGGGETSIDVARKRLIAKGVRFIMSSDIA